MSNGPTVTVATPSWGADAYIPGTAMWWQRIGVEKEKTRIYFVDPITGQVAERVEDIKEWSQESLEALGEMNTVLGQAARDILGSIGEGVERVATTAVLVYGAAVVVVGVASVLTLGGLAWWALK